MTVLPTASALISWEDYKAIFNISDNDEQDKYQILINQASALIESYCRRDLKARDYEEFLDGHEKDVLVLSHYPIQSISAIYIDPAREFGNETVITDFDYDASAGLVYMRNGLFPDGHKIIKAQYRAGYEPTDPAYQVLQSACLEMVKWIAGRYAGFIGKRSETNADGMNIGFEIQMPMNVQSMLQPFVEVAI
jgi:hypothetical protein